MSLNLTPLPENNTLGISTMAVDSFGHLYYNEKWVGALPQQELIGAISHEVLHLALLHIVRKGNRNAVIMLPNGETTLLWNVAVDIVANNLVEEMGYSLPPDVIKNKQLATFPAEEVYYKLLNDKSQNGFRKFFLNGILFDKHIFGVIDKNGKIRDLTEDEKKALENVWAKKAREAATYAQKQGTLPSSLERIFDLVEPKLDWRTILQRFVVKSLPTDVSFRKPNRRSYTCGDFIFPGQIKESLQLHFAIDTSGSIDKETLSQVASEIVGICKVYENIKLIILTSDAQVHQEFTTVEEMLKGVEGGGGTDFRPVFKYVEESQAECNALIYFTDGQGTFPEEAPPYPVLWVLCGYHIQPNEVPFGEVIVIDS